MGFRFQRRLNLGLGVGLNLGRTGTSASGRTFLGSIGTGGFSVRSGVPGLSYRKSFGRGGFGLLVGLMVLAFIFVVNVAVLVAVASANVLLIMIQVLWMMTAVAAKSLAWLVLTASDFLKHIAASRSGSPPSYSLPAPLPPKPSRLVPPLPIHGRPTTPNVHAQRE